MDPEPAVRHGSTARGGRQYGVAVRGGVSSVSWPRCGQLNMIGAGKAGENGQSSYGLAKGHADQTVGVAMA